MFIKKWIRNIFRGILFVIGIFISVFLYHSHFEPFRNAHPEYFRWILKYDVPDQVTIIEKEERITITESDFVPKVIVNSQNAVVNVVSSSEMDNLYSIASGFFITNDGVVVAPTQDILFGEGLEYRVLSTNGDEYVATYIGSDPFTESTFFRIKQEGAPALTIAPQDAFFTGRNIILLSRSVEENTPVAQVTSLSVWAQTRNIAKQSIGSSEKYEGVGIVKNGDSAREGSAVVTYQGELLGMVREVFSQGHSQTGVIPAQALMDALNSLDKEGKHQRPFFGVSYVSLTPELAKIYKLPVSSGAWIKIPGVSSTVVLFGSPAYLSGITQGDIITAVNGISLAVHTPLSGVLSRFHPGEQVTLTVYRNGVERDISVTLSRAKEK